MKTIRRFILGATVLTALLSCFIFAFTAQAAGSTLYISSPVDGRLYSYDGLKVRWNSVSGAAGYYVSIRHVRSDTVVLQNKWTTGNSLDVSSYVEDTLGEYKFWVGAVASSSDSATSCFTQDYVNAYVAHEPDVTNGSASSITQNSATLSMSIDRDYGYDIEDWGFYVGTSSSVGSMEWYSYGSTAKGTKTATITGLSPNTTYYYRAFAENEVGEEYTSYKTFTTAAAPLSDPVVTAPVSGGTYSANQSITLQWNAVSGASGYRYHIKQLAGEPDYSSTSEAAVNTWEGSVSSSTRSYTLAAGNVVGGYWYKFVVEAYASGASSSWSDWCYIYVQKGQLVKANIVSPINSGTYNAYSGIKFDWDAVSGATGYNYFIKRLKGVPDRTNENEPAHESWTGSTGSATTQYTLSASDVLPGYWYKFVVQATAAGMDPSWSEWIYCYAQTGSLDRPVLSSPANWSEKSAGSSITAKWGSVSGATGYRIHIKQLSGSPDSSSENEPAVNTWRVDRGTSLSYTLSADNVAGGYWYKFVVEAYSNTMSPSWSAYSYVYVPINNDLDRPVITSPVSGHNYEAGSDIRFTWGKVDNATKYYYYVKQLTGEPDYSDNEASSSSWIGSTSTTGRLFTLDGQYVMEDTWYKFVVKAEASGYNDSWSRYTYIKIPPREDWIYYVLNEFIEEIGDESFMGNTKLRTFDASKSSLMFIGSKAFSGCTNLQSIYLPDTVNEIASDAFNNCPNLTIHCSAGSYAESYAINKGIPCELHGIAIDSDMVTISEEEWYLSTLDAAETVIHVDSSGKWTASSADTWLTLSATSGNGSANVRLNAAKNTTNARRSTRVTFTCGSATAMLKVVQNANTSGDCAMKLSQDYWEPSSNALTRSIYVESDGGFTVSSDSSWLTYTVNGGEIVLKVTSSALNTQQTGIVSVICSDCGRKKTVTVSTQGVVVPAPSWITGSVIDPRTIQISWGLVEGATYRVERCPSDGEEWEQAAMLSAGVHSFTDSGLDPKTIYRYRVYARKTVSGTTYESDRSNIYRTVTPAEARISLTGKFADVAGGQRVALSDVSTLTWTKTSKATNYKVSVYSYALGGNPSGWDKKSVGDEDNVSISSVLNEGVKYRVWVGGYNADGYIVAQSDAVEFTVQSNVAAPTIKVNRIVPSTINNSGYASFEVEFETKRMDSVLFTFNGIEVSEKWNKDFNDNKQGFKSTWEFDEGDIGDKYSYDTTVWCVSFYPKSGQIVGTYSAAVCAKNDSGLSSDPVTFNITIIERPQVSGNIKTEDDISITIDSNGYERIKRSAGKAYIQKPHYYIAAGGRPNNPNDLDLLIRQFDVMNNYKPDGSTYCNTFAANVARSCGAYLPTSADCQHGGICRKCGKPIRGVDNDYSGMFSYLESNGLVCVCDSATRREYTYMYMGMESTWEETGTGSYGNLLRWLIEHGSEFGWKQINTVTNKSYASKTKSNLSSDTLTSVVDRANSGYLVIGVYSDFVKDKGHVFVVHPHKDAGSTVYTTQAGGSGVSREDATQGDTYTRYANNGWISYYYYSP